MKKMISSVWAALCLAACVTGCTPPPMPSAIIEIGNAGQLAGISSNMNGKYRLTQNITVGSWLPLGLDTNPFTGELDGNGYTITINSFSATENASAGIAYYGLFGYIKGGKVHHLKVSGTSLSRTSDKTLQLGAIVGCLEGGSIEQCISDVALMGSGSSITQNSLVGGIAGNVFGSGVIKNCYSLKSVTAGKGTNGAGTAIAGGIAGGLYGGVVSECYAAGQANTLALAPPPNGTAYAGGIVGYCTSVGADLGKVSRCIAVNAGITAGAATTYVHRVVGGSSSASISNNYALIGLPIGPTPAQNGTDITEELLKFSHNWTMSPLSWSTNIWNFDHLSTGYPLLRNVGTL